MTREYQRHLSDEEWAKLKKDNGQRAARTRRASHAVGCAHPGGCERPARTRGWCAMHYMRVWLTGDPGPAESQRRPYHQRCEHPENCPRMATMNGHCEMHAQRLADSGELGPVGPKVRPRNVPASPCRLEGCEQPSSAKGWCRMHYLRVRRDGAPGPVLTVEYEDPAPEGQKTCRRCQSVKSLEGFYPYRSRGKVGVQNWCKDCQREVIRMRSYNLTADEVRALLGAGCCAICGATERLAIDHDHDTGRVRGLLCQACNKGIGFLGDDPDRVRRALAYLTGFSAQLTTTGS